MAAFWIDGIFRMALFLSAMAPPLLYPASSHRLRRSMGSRPKNISIGWPFVRLLLFLFIPLISYFW